MSLQWQWLMELGSWLWGRSKAKPKPHIPNTILIVEDNADDAELLSICLAKHNMVGTVTHTAEGALALIDRNSISIAFVDLRLKFMPGWELIPLIRLRSPHTLIVVLCGEIADVQNIHDPVWPLVIIEKPASVEAIERLVSHLKT